MACYGFPFRIYFELLSQPAYLPGGSIFYDTYLGDPATTYNTSAPFLGYTNPNYYTSNPNQTCKDVQYNVQANQGYPNWYSPITNSVDLRAAYVTCGNCPLSSGFCPIFTWPDYDDVLHTVSPITGYQIAYTA